jgi:hypothetical protein
MKSYGLSIMPEAGDGKIPVSDANGLVVWTTATGSGAPVRATSPTLVTPLSASLTAPNNSLVLKPTVDAVTAIQFCDKDSNSILNIDTTNNRVGIGTNSPSQLLQVVSGNNQFSITGERLIAVAVSDSVYADFIGYRAKAAFAPAVNNDILAIIQGIGFGSTTWSGGASIFFAAAETMTDTSGATKIIMSTCPSGSKSPINRMEVASDGNVGIGIASPRKKLHVAGTLLVDGDEGGYANTIGLTDISDTSANSTGAGSIKLKGTTARDSAGFIKVYIGTTAYYVPVFSAITG